MKTMTKQKDTTEILVDSFIMLDKPETSTI